MARAPDERINEAYELYKKGFKLVEIASQLNLPDGTVRRWKSTHKWDSERSVKNNERSKRKKGGQKGNKNATGPPGNKNAEKFGFFSKYLPEETKEIFDAIESANPLDLLWHQIQLAYTAIIRAQHIMNVTDKYEMIKELKKKKSRSSEMSESNETEYEFQFAWDRQATFIKAQARAQTELRCMIKQYDEMLHKNWEMATDEQKAKLNLMQAQIDNINKDKDNSEGGVTIVNDIPRPNSNQVN